MSRSRRKTPITGFCAESDKAFKTQAHRRERCLVSQMLRREFEPEELPHPKTFGNPWDSPKDGRQLVDPNSRWMRK